MTDAATLTTIARRASSGRLAAMPEPPLPDGQVLFTRLTTPQIIALSMLRNWGPFDACWNGFKKTHGAGALYISGNTARSLADRGMVLIARDGGTVTLTDKGAAVWQTLFAPGGLPLVPAWTKRGQTNA